MKIAGLILAGGAGRRLGGVDKALLRLHHLPMLAHVMKRLAPQVDALALSAQGDPARFAGFGLPVLDDGGHRGKGPLAGLAAGLAWAAGAGMDALLTLPVDTPFIPADLVRRLGRAPAVACHQGRVHHLVALWPADAGAALGAFLERDGPCRVADFARALGMRPVEFPDQPDPFHNVNTPADLDAAEARLKHPSP
ncbi:MAG TPA: molybdenum cofactor guanylyltransferase MobA [Acetobacteraceae bacterium]|nr:molybdenum cofactor guanylyltransferase MobA [Acetobacteraceae bacterium]